MSEFDSAAAEKLVKEAESLLVQKGWFIFKESPRYSEASELFTRAGNMYKANKDLRGAGNCFLQAAEADIKGSEPDEGARSLINAANCFKKVEPEQAIDILRRAIDILLRTGRFHVAASHEKDVAELYEQLGDYVNAILFFERAADRFNAEDSSAIAQKYILKAAELSALVEDYQKSIDLYEAAARESLNNQITRYSVKEYFFRAALCRICMTDSVGANQALDRYSVEDPSFGKTREFKLLTEILVAIEEGNAEKFTTEVIEYERVGLLDDWKTKILLRIKKSIGEEPSLM